MKKIKLIEGLKMLDRSEWTSFQKYLLMSCTEKSDQYELVQQLFLIQNELEDLEGIDAVKNPKFEHMSNKVFSNLMSRVYGLFEEWLFWYETKKDEDYREVELVKIFNRRGKYSLADKAYNRVSKRLREHDQLDFNTHKLMYQLYHNHYFSDNPVKYRRKEDILNLLVSYYSQQVAEQSLMYIVELHNWGIVNNYDMSHEIKLLEKMVNGSEDSEVTSVINLILRLVRDMDVEAFIKLKDIIHANQLRPGTELHILSSFYMITFSLRLWNAKKISDPTYVFDAYNYGLESRILLLSGKITFVRFITMVATLGNVKASKSNYDFVDRWKHLVAEENEASVKAMGYAELKFYERKLDEIIPLLVGQRFETDLARLRASALELIGLYPDRRNDYGFLVNKINNYKRVLRTYGEKSTNQTYLLFSNFTKVFDLLVKRDFANIKIRLEDYFPIVYNTWLEEEIKAGNK